MGPLNRYERRDVHRFMKNVKSMQRLIERQSIIYKEQVAKETLDLEHGERVRVPEAPLEAPEPEDGLVEHGERLGAAGHGRAPLSPRTPRKQT